MTNTAGRKDWGYCQLAIKKIESQSLEWNQGINENISPAQYGNGLDPNDKTNLYQIFDNIKVNAAGHLVRENGYEKLNYPNPNTYPNNIADYISYAGEGQFPPQNTQTWQLTGEPYGLGTEILFNGELYKRVRSGNTPPTQPDCPVGRLWSNLGSLPSWPTDHNDYTYFQGQDIIFNGGVYQLLIPKIIISYNSTTPDQPNQITVWKCVGNYYGWNVSSIYAVGAYVNYEALVAQTPYHIWTKLKGLSTVQVASLAAEIGDPAHYADARQVFRRSGLVSGRNNSGSKQRKGKGNPILKTGDVYLRRALMNATTTVLLHQPVLLHYYRQL